MEALANIPGVEVVTLDRRPPPKAPRSSPRNGRSRIGPRISRESLKQPGVEAVILTSPTQIHAEQAEQAMRAGKHVLIEIPMADTLAD